MESNLLLERSNYSLYNALVWGNCLNHAKQVWSPAPFTKQERLFHATLALVELIPIISQIISLFEMAIAYCYKKKSSPAPLTQAISLQTPLKKDVKRGDLSVLMQMPVQEVTSTQITIPVRQVQPSPPLPKTVPCEFRSDRSSDKLSIFSLYAEMAQQYRKLPWPEQVKEVVVFTDICGGRGDVAAAAKAIHNLLEFCSSSVRVEWVWSGSLPKSCTLESFLSKEDLCRVQVRNCFDAPDTEYTQPCDLLIVGPVLCSYELSRLEGEIKRKVTGGAFGFVENGTSLAFQSNFLEDANGELLKVTSPQELHTALFPVSVGNGKGQIPMGIREYSGVFLDESRIEAPLSQGYYCPLYLGQISDPTLKQDILGAMGVKSETEHPNSDHHSFNLGYAHDLTSWLNYIKVVCLHETEKHVVLVLNRESEFYKKSCESFREDVFSEEVLKFLEENGYGTVILKDEDKEACLVQRCENARSKRRFTLIVRSSFNPNDMKMMQLAAERLLATGDNSAVEAFCARCKLYVYENVRNSPIVKQSFLKQQIKAAASISQEVSRLLELFGNAKKLFSAEQIQELQGIFKKKNLGEETIRFCDEIVKNYSFRFLFEGALKRVAWHTTNPEKFTQVEMEALTLELCNDLLGHYNKEPLDQPKSYQINLKDLGNHLKNLI